MQDFERLGVFYLGRVRGPAGTVSAEPLLYDARDLTTHGVIVGMTGSGKTGLAVSLLEEAAIDGVPAIAIDPKGDLGNLLLAFPELRPEDFRPWIDEGEAQRAGMDADAYAKRTADTWSKGLASWGQDGARVGRYRSAADLAIYTPGSSAGLPLSILTSLEAPAAALAGDADALRERIAGTVSALLGLLEVDADPLRSREHILVAKLVDRAWSEGRALDLGALIREIQSPPFDRVGVMDLESFFPAKDRASLAMRLNNLLASPGFAAWTEGEPLDVAKLFWTAGGKPKLSVISIAHLSDAERMFFVTLLLGEVLAWMRGQSGTSSLRALVYMDEVFGYFPPVANPPSKTPMLTLLKQARAFGVGIVLATQNPVDLDYKGLSNAGTWFLGRLQTERDKLRVLEGLEGASAASGKSFDRAKADAILSGLENRVFLMHNVHEDAPVLFESRWALSYLRGPLTRVQIQSLMAPQKAAAGGAAAARSSAGPAAAPARPAAVEATSAAPRPVLPPDVPERFLSPAGAAPAGAKLLYRPMLCAAAKLHYVDAKAGVDAWEPVALLAGFASGGSGGDWASAEALPGERPALAAIPEASGAFAELPAEAARARNYAAWKKSFANWLYQGRTLTLSRCQDLALVGKPGQSEGDFKVCVQHALRERRDEEVDALRRRYESKIRQSADRERRAQERVDREASQAQQQTLQSAISVGASFLGALMGRKVLSASNVSRAGTAARGLGRAAREREDVGSAQEALEAVRRQRAELEDELKAEIDALGAAEEPAIDTAEVRARKGDIAVETFVLAWAPWWIAPDGGERPAWR